MATMPAMVAARRRTHFAAEAGFVEKVNGARGPRRSKRRDGWVGDNNLLYVAVADAPETRIAPATRS
jgi:hypothetical protein